MNGVKQRGKSQTQDGLSGEGWPKKYSSESTKEKFPGKTGHHFEGRVGKYVLRHLKLLDKKSGLKKKKSRLGRGGGGVGKKKINERLYFVTYFGAPGGERAIQLEEKRMKGKVRLGDNGEPPKTKQNTEKKAIGEENNISFEQEKNCAGGAKTLENGV